MSGILAERVKPPYGYAIYPDREMYEAQMVVIGHDDAGHEIKALHPGWAGPYNHRLQCLRGPHKKGNLVGAHKQDAYYFGEEKNYEAALRWIETHEWEWHGGEPPGPLSFLRTWIDL